MSAIGTVVRMRQEDLDRCLTLASGIHKKSVGWLLKEEVEVGADEFQQAWKSAVVEEGEFSGSGWVFSDYFSAQRELSGLDEYPFVWTSAEPLARAFTGAFPIRSPLALPPLQDEHLRRYCLEFGDDALPMFDALRAAHEFFLAWIAKVSSEYAVIFIVS